VGPKFGSAVLGDDYQHALRRLASYGTRSARERNYGRPLKTGHEDAELYGGAHLLRGLAGMGRYPAKGSTLTAVSLPPPRSVKALIVRLHV